MTIQLSSPNLSDGVSERFVCDAMPVTLCITRDPAERARVVAALGPDSIIVMVPDRLSALSVLIQSNLGREPVNNSVGHADDGVPSGPIADRIVRVAPSAPVDEIAPTLLVCGELVVDRDRARVSWAGRPIALTQLEIEVLACLTSRPGRVWSYERLHIEAWGSRYLGDRNSLHSLVKRLRRKLRAAGIALDVHAVRGVGFQLIPLTDLPASAPI